MKKEPEQSIKNKENLQIYKHDTKGCSNIFKTITIDPYSDVYSCCGLTMRNMSSMKIGNIKKNSIMEIYSSQFEDFLKVWIHTDGPNNIMKYIYEKMGTEYDAEQEQIHECSACEKIFNNPQYIQVIRNNYYQIYTNVFLKYFLNKQSK